jgi:hypothetical protein
MAELWEGLLIAGSGAFVGSAATYFFTKRLQRIRGIDLYLDRFREREIDHVGVFNFGDGFIDSCQVLSDDVICNWWDGHTGPRSITKRGANAQLPTDHVDNPVVRIMSRHKKLRTIRFLDITPRVSSI